MNIDEHQVPFCEIQYNCSFSEEGVLVLWECLPRTCQQRLEGFTALLLTLSVLTATFNATVLLANLLPSTRRMLRRNPTMENYSTYVVSMAMADLLLGIVLLPTAVSYFYSEMKAQRHHVNFENDAVFDAKQGLPIPRSFNETFTTNGTMQIEEISNFTSVYLKPSDRSKLERMLYCVGVLTHMAIFVSMYTLAAASADRFYTSRKPIISRSIKLTSTSFRSKSGFSASDGSSRDPCINVRRSTVVVVVIWMLGIAFSMLPLFMHPDLHFQAVGHMFVILKANASATGTFLGYTISLGLPLVVTWMFSVLICITLWRRKKRLKNTYSAKGISTRRNSSVHRSQPRNRMNNQLSRFSVTESHVTPSVTDKTLRNDSESAPQEVSEPLNGSFKGLQRAPQYAVRDVTPINKRKETMKSDLHPHRRTRRPSSLDLTLIKKLAENGDDVTAVKAPASLPVGTEFFNLQTMSKSKGSFVAKRLLLRGSWAGSIDESNLYASSPPKATAVAHQLSDGSSGAQASTPAASIKPSDRKSECAARNPRTPTRMRRKSSVFRAREFIRLKTFESNIAKTLFGVVIAITIAVLPLLIVLICIAVEAARTPFQLKENVSRVVLTMAILFSNSLWNCLIYGARMPYFRQAISRLFRRSLSRLKTTYCGRSFRNVCRHVRMKLRRRPRAATASPMQTRSKDNLSESTRSRVQNSREDYSPYIMKALDS